MVAGTAGKRPVAAQNRAAGAKPARASAVAARPRGGRPTKQAAEELDRRILETAARLFSTQGFAGTAMEQVAAECGAGKDTIYRRYASKAALFTAISDRLRAQVISEMDAAMAADLPVMEKLKRYARTLLAINMRPDLLALNRVALAEAVPVGGVKATPTAEDPFMIRFSALVARAQREGLAGPGDPLFMADQLLYATSIKPMITAMLGRPEFADAAAQDAYFEGAWTLALRGIAPG
ncbi:TetR family transcriptional regulator [Azorhizobium oxalatiphilum]|uniref:TetR family transcriptional regulator n=1 Tax=Azorhizobium oxalatiphilum TaxID=980631 RepID=A0A917CIB5_9HYPH|nr:TetR/AcrR family transcriptional regulator [Azorhizobium oxalatiphilum]GGF89885.1 TetR family transcriptional regulator [Azorhizobium oxalatiphilum]